MHDFLRGKSCKHDHCLNRISIFSDLVGDEMEAVEQMIYRKMYEKNEEIIMEGDPVNHLIVIHSGRVKAYRHTPDGKEQILYIFSTGDFFGERHLLGPQQNHYGVRALTSTCLCMIRRKDFEALLINHPKIAIKIIEQMNKRLISLENAIHEMGTGGIDARIRSMLLDFAKEYGHHDEKGVLIRLPLSREGLANWLGVTRETVSRKLNALQEAALIERVGHKSIRIFDLQKFKTDTCTDSVRTQKTEW